MRKVLLNLLALALLCSPAVLVVVHQTKPVAAKVTVEEFELPIEPVQF